LAERDIYSFMQRNRFQFSEEHAFKLFKQMVSALKACHDNKICHHDMKLENCVINSNNEMKLIDFAYALEWTDSNCVFAKFNGSPAYSAPEILFRKPHNASVDIFGLGTCLYYMICQCFPFCDEENTSYEELCQNVRLFNLEFPEFVSPDAKDLITKMLSKENRISIQDIKHHNWYRFHKQRSMRESM
jgi:serine/threonine protein kinase